MQTPDDCPSGATSTQDYSSLPPSVPLDETIASVDADPVPDPHAGRNVDLHRALRDD